MVLRRTMIGLGLGMAVALGGCAAVRDSGSSGGVAYRIDEDIDALEEAMDSAAAHCDRHDRAAALQGLSQVSDDTYLATFNCETSRASGVTVVTDEDDGLDGAERRAGAYCDDYDRLAVLQTVTEFDGRDIAAFSCARP